MPRVGPEEVHPAELVSARMHDLTCKILLGQIAYGRKGRATCGTNDRNGLLGRIVVAINHQHLRTFACEA
ncbi:hypothetical protein D3C86_1716490 [compost metagenome]